MRCTLAGFLAAALLSSQAGAEPVLEGRVRLASGEPAAGARVLLFDLADLRAPPARATTDASGRFTLPAGALSSGVRTLPQHLHLGPNYPNPFNPATIIPYELPTAAHVRLEVFNLLGQRIATLLDGPQPAGYHSARWHGTEAVGRAAAAGVYLYRLRAGDDTRTGRMVLVDGQAGVPAVAPGGRGVWDRSLLEAGPVYGLVVSGAGLTPYVDPGFQVPAGGGEVDLVVQRLGGSPAAKRASTPTDRLLGDVDNNGRVDVADALLVALYSFDSSTVMPNEGDIALGDVNGDGRVDISDAWLLLIHSVDPSSPLLPAGIGGPVAPLISPEEGKIYWADWTTDRIHRANRDGSQVEDVVTGVVAPAGLAVDGAGGKLYWADRGTDKIQRSNLDGSQVEDLVTTGLVTPSGLALDAAGGKLYWTDSGADRIQRSNLDGSDVEDLVTTLLLTPRGLAVDGVEGRVYWTDSGRKRIKRCNLDGTAVEVLVSSGLGTPVVLALHGTPVVEEDWPPELSAYHLWRLPEGALARLGKGSIAEGDRAVAYSPDGELLAVAGSIGIWLYDARTGDEAGLLTGPGESATSVAFSPDGAVLARGGSDRTIRLWDVASGRIQAILEGHQGRVISVAFSPDGATLASAGGWEDETFRLWDVASGRLRATLKSHKPPTSMAFSPDGAILAGGSATSGDFKDKPTIQLWDVASGRLKADLPYRGYVASVAFSPDGSTLASAAENNAVYLWDVTTGKAEIRRGRQDWEHSRFTQSWDVIHPVLSVAFSPNGSLATSSGYERAIHLGTYELEGPGDKGYSLAFSPDGSSLASTTSRGDKVHLWDVAGGHLQTVLKHDSEGGLLAFSPDGSVLTSVDSRRIRLWRTSGEAQATLQSDHSPAAIAFSPDGSTLASGDGGRIRLWDVERGQSEAVLDGHDTRVTRLAFSPDGSTLASTADWQDSTIWLWDVPSRLHRATLRGHTTFINSLAISPDGATLASGGGPRDPTVRLWNLADGQLRTTLEAHEDEVDWLAFSPDGATLASASRLESTIILLDVASGEIRDRLWDGNRRVYHLAFSPDGSTLASGFGWPREEAGIHLWDVASGQRKATLEGLVEHPTSMAFSPDGSVLVCSDGGLGSVRVWDVASGQLRTSLEGHSWLAWPTFSPDGSILATGSWDGTILLWDMAAYLSGGAHLSEGPGHP